jgi:hypothetical protein
MPPGLGGFPKKPLGGTASGLVSVWTAAWTPIAGVSRALGASFGPTWSVAPFPGSAIALRASCGLVPVAVAGFLIGWNLLIVSPPSDRFDRGL